MQKLHSCSCLTITPTNFYFFNRHLFPHHSGADSYGRPHPLELLRQCYKKAAQSPFDPWWLTFFHPIIRKNASCVK